MAKKVTDPALLAQLNGGSSAAGEAAAPGGVKGPMPAAPAGAKVAGASATSQVSPSGGKAVTDPEVLKRLNAQPSATDKAVEFTTRRMMPLSDTYASSAMSGVNEGVAHLLSLPTMVGNGILSIGPAIGNTLFPAEKTKTDLILGTEPEPRFKYPNYIPDAGPPARELMKAVGAIRPPSDDIGQQAARRVGQEVGASLPLGLAKPAATIISAIGSGLGATLANEIDPNNPWLELAGQFGGAAATSVLAGAAKRLAISSPKPKGATLTAGDLELLKNEAYKTVDNLGAKYSPQGYGKMLSQMDAAVKNISPTRHPKAYSLLQDLKARASTQYSGGLSLTELDHVRQEIRRDLLQSSDASERHYGDLMMDEVDDFIRKAGAGDMVAGDAKAADEAVRAARELNTRFRKTEMIEDALRAADLKTAAANGDLNTAVRRAFNTILLNPKRAASYSADEIADMEKLVKSGDGSNMLRNIGKLSGDTGIKALVHGFLSTQLGPAYAVVPLLGPGAKALAGGRIVKGADDLRGRIAAGPVPSSGNSLRFPSVDPAALGATLVGGMSNTIANENERKRREGNTLMLNQGSGAGGTGAGPNGSHQGVL